MANEKITDIVVLLQKNTSKPIHDSNTPLTQ